jgi:hypothetical protein
LRREELLRYAYETGPHKGQKQFGIYERDGNKWTVCMTPPRPR